VYSVIEEELPGGWRYRMDRIWHNTETNELVTIRRSTMAEMGDGDGYKVCIHRGHGVNTVLDNVSLEQANKAIALYIMQGTYPEQSWLHQN
jgi:hypothetical protein